MSHGGSRVPAHRIILLDTGTIMTVQLDPVALNEVRERFLTVEHDFGEFGDPDGEYYRDERLYKDDLRRLYGELLPTSLLSADPADRADEIVRRVRSILTRPVGLDGGAQNLVSYWDYRFLEEMKPAERAVFARGLADLILGTGPSGDRIERFNRNMWPVWKRIAGPRNKYSVTRSFPTLFLMLPDPDHEICVVTRTFERASWRTARSSRTRTSGRSNTWKSCTRITSRNPMPRTGRSSRN